MIAEKGIRVRIYQATHKYAKANNKYMKNYDKHIESSYLMYLDANNLYGRAMSQKLLINGFKWVKKLSKFNEKVIKSHNENSDKENLKYMQSIRKLYLILMRIYHFYEKEKKGKVEKLICGIEKHVIHIRALQQALNHGLKLKKIERVIQFNQEAWLKHILT